MMPQDYQPVYDGPQIKEPISKHVLFDDDAYGTHRPPSKGAAVQLGVDGNRAESTPHSETIAMVKEKMLTPDNEVEYAEPFQPLNTKSPAQLAQAKSEHFYHSLEHNEPTKLEKCVSGVPYSNESSSPVTFASSSNYFSEDKFAPKDQITADAKCQTQTLTSLYDNTHALDEVGAMLNAPMLFNVDQCEFDDPMYEGIPRSVPKQTDKNPSLSLEEKMQTMLLLSEEASCIGDVNDDPELLNHDEDMNAPEYSDPVVPGFLDDINIMATDQRDSTVNIYDTFDDPTL